MKHHLDYAEVNITNVCNYSCLHCQSLNNFSFKGHQLWSDYQEEYKKLSDRIDIGTIQIIGGEPTLNPDFKKWIEGLSDLWPNSRLQICSNGTRLDKLDRSIYEILKRHKGSGLGLTCHDIKIYNKLLDFSKRFLNKIVSEYDPYDNDHDAWKINYNSIKKEHWPDCDRIEQFDNLSETIKQEFNEIHRSKSKLNLKTVARMFIDENGVELKLEWTQSFIPSAIKLVNDRHLKIKHNSDPTEAHDVCWFKGCHQFNKGKLYKCPLVSVLPDFINQFDVDFNDDYILARSYKALSNSDSDIEISEFIKNIKNPIPQCKFCPTNNDRYNFVGTDKKIKIYPVS